MNELVVKNEKFGELEVYVDEKGKVWFPATEVAEILGYKNPQKAIRDHCKEAGCTIRSVSYPSGTKQKKYINEGNVIRLLTKSHIPGAEEFESWIFDEVIPRIMKTGNYSIQKNGPVAPMTIEDMIITLATETKVVKGDIAEIKDKLNNQMTIDSGQQNKIRNLVSRRVYERSEQTGLENKVLFSALHRELRNTFGVPSYRDIKTVDFEDAVNYVKAWIEKAEIRNSREA